MRQVTVTLFQYDELPTDAAKSKARDWMRETESEFFGQFGELWEPAETAAKLLGIQFADNVVKLANGKTRTEPDIRYSGFSSQGDGASFVGTYQYAKNGARRIASEFPTDSELQRIARELQELQRKHGYKLTANITQSGHYSHSGTMYADVSKDSPTQPDVYDETAGAVLTLMRNFADWIYRGLREEYEYRLSDEALEDSIRANEYDFRENGERSDG